ncbi:HD-GYP domain-containing protein [Cohnella algarum]|nr:HD-GYP domain-containing protein [Cohnella algarum]
MRNMLNTGLLTLGRQFDSVTFSHSLRVGMLAHAMAEELDMPAQDRHRFTLACCFHDVGKLLVPQAILSKPFALDEAERAMLQAHPVLGIRLVRKLGWRDRRMIDTVRSHHERWDGGGYPDGLAGERIPQWARMCAVADAFDAMVQPRSYNRVRSIREAREELYRQQSVHFDGTYVDLFLKIPEPAIHRIQNLN